jgi:hypothetical protein
MEFSRIILAAICNFISECPNKNGKFLTYQQGLTILPSRSRQLDDCIPVYVWNGKC